MSERRNGPVAAIPLAIALFGSAALTTGGAPDSRRFRVSPQRIAGPCGDGTA